MSYDEAFQYFHKKASFGIDTQLYLPDTDTTKNSTIVLLAKSGKHYYRSTPCS
jgi:hypothetical protein